MYKIISGSDGSELNDQDQKYFAGQVGIQSLASKKWDILAQARARAQAELGLDPRQGRVGDVVIGAQIIERSKPKRTVLDVNYSGMSTNAILAHHTLQQEIGKICDFLREAGLAGEYGSFKNVMECLMAMAVSDPEDSQKQLELLEYFINQLEPGEEKEALSDAVAAISEQLPEIQASQGERTVKRMFMGIMAALVQTSMMCWADMGITRAQTKPEKYDTVLRAILGREGVRLKDLGQIIRQEKLAGLFKHAHFTAGIRPALLTRMVYFMVAYGIEDLGRAIIKRPNPMPLTLKEKLVTVFPASAAAVVAITFGEWAKIQVQAAVTRSINDAGLPAQKKPKLTILQRVKKLFTFRSGIVSTTLREGGFFFMAFHGPKMFQSGLVSMIGHHNTNAFMADYGSGVLAGYLTAGFNNIKTKVQAAEKPVSEWQVVRDWTKKRVLAKKLFGGPPTKIRAILYISGSFIAMDVGGKLAIWIWGAMSNQGVIRASEPHSTRPHRWGGVMALSPYTNGLLLVEKSEDGFPDSDPFSGP